MYCTVEEVRESINFPTVGAPIEDNVIEQFIIQSQEEIEDIYKTNFGSIDEYGTADGNFTVNTFSDSNQTWKTDEYEGWVVWIYSGTGSGQYRNIVSNTSILLTVAPDFTTVPDATSKYRIVKLGYKDETVDGTGTNTQFVEYQPLINLIELTIDGTSVTPSTVAQYFPQGKLILTSESESSWFSNNDYQQVNIKYIYGVYPLPKIIKRLCIVISGIRTLISQVAGTYDDFTTVSLPGGFNASKGEPYVNIVNAIDRFQQEAKGIIYGAQSTGQISGDFRQASSFRPYTLFG